MFFIIRWVNDTFVSEFAVITAILAIMGAMASITDLIGVHTVLGAFVAGILIGESPILTRHIDEQLRGLITAFFAPVFFGIAGLSADLTILADPKIALLTVGLILIASIGKFGGAFIGGELGGLTRREGFALACGMNARGSTEVIIATIGLSMGALNQNLFTMIVDHGGDHHHWRCRRRCAGRSRAFPCARRKSSGSNARRWKASGFVPNLERLLIAVDDSANGKFASRVAGMLAGTHGMPTTVLHITDAGQDRRQKADAGPKMRRQGRAARRPKRRPTSRNPSQEGRQESQEKIEEKRRPKRPARPSSKPPSRSRASRRKKRRSTRRSTSPPSCTKRRDPDVIAEEAEKGYDLMLIGWRRPPHREQGIPRKRDRVWPWASRDRWRSPPCAAISRKSPTASSAFWCR